MDVPSWTNAAGLAGRPDRSPGLSGRSSFCRVGGSWWSETAPLVLVSGVFGFVPGRTIKQNGDRFAAGGDVAGGRAGKERVLNDSRLSESGSQQCSEMNLVEITGLLPSGDR